MAQTPPTIAQRQVQPDAQCGQIRCQRSRMSRGPFAHHDACGREHAVRMSGRDRPIGGFRYAEVIGREYDGSFHGCIMDHADLAFRSPIARYPMNGRSRGGKVT